MKFMFNVKKKLQGVFKKKEKKLWKYVNKMGAKL